MHSRVFQYVGIILVFIFFGGGCWYWKNTHAAETVTNNRPSFEALLTIGIDLTAGTGMGTFARADGANGRATITDWEGLVRPVKTNEARFEGARRVENLNPQSEADSGWTAGGATPPTVSTSVVYNGKTAVSTTFASGLNGWATTRATGSNFSIILGNTLTYRFAVAASRPLTGSESVNIFITGQNGITAVPFSTSKNFSTTWTTYSASGSMTSNEGNEYFAIYPATNLSSPITIYITERQCENVSGQSNQNPSEYVSTGVKTSVPYHGANVDGVKYFSYQNGNTVASNLVTEAKGAAIPDTTLHGYVAEGSRTNLALQSEIFDVATTVNFTGSPTGQYTAGETVNASGGGSAVVARYSTGTNYMFATNQTGTFTGTLTGATSGAVATIASTTPSTVYWAPSNLRVTTGMLSNSVSPGGNPYTPDILTATAGNGTLLQSVTSASADRDFSIWLKRKTGTGNIDLTVDNGVTWTTKTITSSWVRYDITQTAVTNPVIGIRIVTNGDEVYAWGAQLESASFASSYIPTLTSAVTRAADILTYPTAGNFDGANGSIYAEMSFNPGNTGTSHGITLETDNALIYKGNAGVAAGQTGSPNIFAGSWGNDGVIRKAASSWTTGKRSVVLNGGTVTTSATSPSFTGSTLRIAHNGASALTPSYGTIRNVKIWKKTLSDTDLKNLTSTTTAVSNSVIKKTTVVTPNNTGLIGYWSFDDGSGTTAEDFSPNGTNIGTLTNGPIWTNGRVGKAVIFDGTDDYAGIPTAKINSGDFTYSIWVKKNTVPNVNERIIGQGTVGSGNYIFVGINQSGTYSYQMSGGATRDTSIASSNGWDHTVLTYSQGRATFYLNGSIVYSTLETPDYTNAQGTFIGTSASLASSAFFKGSLDEARIYNRALSADEVAGLYRQSVETKLDVSQDTRLTNGLVGLWSFDGPDVSGTTAYDMSGSGNNGTLRNGSIVAVGKIGQALSLDGGTQDVDLPTLPSLVAPYSVSVWMKPTVLTSGSLVSLSGVNGFPMFKLNSNYKLLAYAGLEKYRYGTKVFSASDLNQWWYVVFVVADSSSLASWKVYLNGVDDTGTAGNNSGTYYEPGTAGSIGSNRGSNPHFSGSLDEVRVYNRVLTAAEVASLYNQGR